MDKTPADYEGISPKNHIRESYSSLEYRDFIKLPLDERKKIFYKFQADFAIVKGLIKDRNDFKQLYYILLRQLIEHNIKPDVVYMKSDIEDIKNGKIL